MDRNRELLLDVLAEITKIKAMLNEMRRTLSKGLPPRDDEGKPDGSG
jgi:hypothetical protein